MKDYGKLIDNAIAQIDSIDKELLEFQMITSFTLNQFKQLYAARIIKIVPVPEKINSLSEIHQEIKKIGLQQAIDEYRYEDTVRKILKNDKKI